MAGSSLYLLLQIEGSIKGYADSIKPIEYENKFEELVDEAVNNYKQFLAIGGADRLKYEMLTNFTDFFNTCIDVKKAEIIQMAGVELEGPAASASQN